MIFCLFILEMLDREEELRAFGTYALIEPVEEARKNAQASLPQDVCPPSGQTVHFINEPGLAGFFFPFKWGSVKPSNLLPGKMPTFWLELVYFIWPPTVAWVVLGDFLPKSSL